MEILSRADIDVNSATVNGREKKTVLYLAIERDNIEIIDKLLSKSAIDVNKKTILELPIEETNNYYYGEISHEPNTFDQHGGHHARMHESDN